MRLSLRSKILSITALLILLVFGVVKALVLFEQIHSTDITRWTEAICFVLFMFNASVIARDILLFSKRTHKEYTYIGKLNEVLVRQSHNPLFYEGDVLNGAKELTLQVSEAIGSDRCSIWLYSEDKNSIRCEQLYIKAENQWYQNIELHKKDFGPYFEALQKNPIIIAHNAEKHPATSCFTEGYLKPLGVKSMLDVPVIFGGEIIGVICIESLTSRVWKDSEVNFAQNLSSLYSFAYSVKMSTTMENEMIELEKFLEESAIISKADAEGKITYVNKKFEEISGWTLKEVLGNDHNIVNSGEHPKEFWSNMYRVVIKDREIWNGICTNRSKTGDLYYVDTFIKAHFGEDGKLKGFMSIRQDVTDIVKASREIEKKNTYLEHAAKILRHDMHSGINTYIPRGITSFERRIPEEKQKELKIDAPMKMIKEGLRHTQKVYKGVYEFTNLVKKDVVLNKTMCNIKDILEDYLTSTAYRPQVIFGDLGECEVNEALFCTAIDNLIRNGLKYNDSLKKEVHIRRESNVLFVEDNGRGMTSEEFRYLSQPYTRKLEQKEPGTGLGLNICIAILEEHGFSIDCEKLSEGGTQLQITLK